LRGKLHFPHTPISDFADGVMWSRGASFRGCGGPAGLTCRPLAANSSPPVFDGLWRRAFAALRSAASLLLLAAHFF